MLFCVTRCHLAAFVYTVSFLVIMTVGRLYAPFVCVLPWVQAWR